jgi:hypothetical protein
MVDFAPPPMLTASYACSLDSKTQGYQHRYELRNKFLYDVKWRPQFAS